MHKPIRQNIATLIACLIIGGSIATWADCPTPLPPARIAIGGCNIYQDDNDIWHCTASPDVWANGGCIGPDGFVDTCTENKVPESVRSFSCQPVHGDPNNPNQVTGYTCQNDGSQNGNYTNGQDTGNLCVPPI